MDYQRKKKDMVSTIYDNKGGREATPTLDWLEWPVHSYILQNYYYAYYETILFNQWPEGLQRGRKVYVKIFAHFI